jgi:hypothetical protein
MTLNIMKFVIFGLTALSIMILSRTVKYITQEAGMYSVMMSKCRSDEWRVAGSL